MPPPWAAELPDSVQPLTVSVPPLRIAPPSRVAELPDSVQRLIVTVALLASRIAPPSVAEFPDRVQSFTVIVVAAPLLKMAPPGAPTWMPAGAELPEKVLFATVICPSWL